MFYKSHSGAVQIGYSSVNTVDHCGTEDLKTIILNTNRDNTPSIASGFTR